MQRRQVFKTWRCTNEEVNKAHLTGGNFKYDTCPVTAKAINKQGSRRFISCNKVRDKFYSLRFWIDIDDGYGVIHHCEFYKGEYRRHPAIPPVKNRLPVPPKAIKTISQAGEYRRHPAIPPVKNRLPVPPKAIKTNSQVADSSD